MEPALSPFVATVKSITLLPPCISYISNVTGKWITNEQATSPDYYATHLRRAVQFEAGVRTIAVDPTTVFLEVGPGTTLTSMVRLIVGKEKAKYVISSLPHRRNENADDAAMLEAAGRMWLAGVELDWTNLHAGASPQRIPLPTYPFERKWYGVNPPSPTTRATKPIVPEREEDIGDWLFSPTWTRESSHLILAPRLEGPWLLLAQPSPLAEVLVDRLRAAGAHPVVVESSASFQMVNTTHFRARPGQSEDIASIAKSLQSEHPIQGAIYLGSGSVSDVSADLASYRELVAIAEGLDISPSGPPLPVIVATFGAESVLSEPAYNPAAALTHGPILVLPTEVPQLRMRAVDFEPYRVPGPTPGHRSGPRRRSRQSRSRKYRCMAQWPSLDETVRAALTAKFQSRFVLGQARWRIPNNRRARRYRPNAGTMVRSQHIRATRAYSENSHPAA